MILRINFKKTAYPIFHLFFTHIHLLIPVITTSFFRPTYHINSPRNVYLQNFPANTTKKECVLFGYHIFIKNHSCFFFNLLVTKLKILRKIYII